MCVCVGGQPFCFVFLFFFFPLFLLSHVPVPLVIGFWLFFWGVGGGVLILGIGRRLIHCNFKTHFQFYSSVIL